MKKISVCLIICFCIGLNSVNASSIEFTDVKDHWAKEEITELNESGIISGYSDGTFRPENNITINEFVKMLVEAGNYTLVREGKNVYPDFYIATAKSNNIINSEYEFDKYMTRYEMVEIISNFIGTEELKENKNIFKDLEKEQKSKVLKLVKLKIINGYEDKTFRGENNVTRAEAATIIFKTLKVREEVILSKKYELKESVNLSNYKSESTSDSNKIVYEIQDSKLKIYDSGRYSVLEDYEVSDEIINLNKVIKIINKLVNEKAYVGVMYVPSKYTINELKILYGDNKNKVLFGEYDFAFNYYENEYYKLATKSMHDEFSDNCYLRIDLIKLWDSYSEYKDGIYIDEFKKEKLSNALEIEFGNSGKGILKYMIEKSIKYVTNEESSKEITEQKVFGRYIVNYYKKENGIPQFYIERK